MAYSNRLMDMFGLRVPILQAPVGSAATPALLQAVGRAGGMGALAFAEMPLSTALDLIGAMNATRLPYFVNYILRFGTDTVRAVAAARPPAITLSWGLDPGLIHDIQTNGVRVGVQVGSLAGAERALAAGADFLIAQGFEAGGHVQSSTPLHGYLGGVVALAGAVPVVAAGGIATGQDIARALGRGAQGVMIGTLYVATL